MAKQKVFAVTVVVKSRSMTEIDEIPWQNGRVSILSFMKSNF